MNALLLRDFDAENLALEAGAGNGNPEEPEEQIFTFTESEIGKLLAEARAEGREQGKQEGDISGRRAERETIEVEAMGAVQALKDQLADFCLQDVARRREMQSDVIDMILDIAERIAPDFLQSYSADLVQARVTEAVHLGVGNSQLAITLSPATQQVLQQTLATLDPSGDLISVSDDPAFKNGEARITWENGFMKYNLDRVCQELLEGLREASAKMKPQPEKV